MNTPWKQVNPNLSRQAEEVDPRYLMKLSPEAREPFLKASVNRALPAYEADRNLPEAERQLTADLETGDFHEYTNESHGSIVGRMNRIPGTDDDRNP